MTAVDPADDSVATNLPRWQVYALVALLVLLANVPLVCLILLWPERADLAGPSQVHLLGWAWTVSPERRILLCVTFCGLLGGSTRMLLRIRGDFTAPEVRKWYVPWYFLTPPMGAVLALGFYLVVRGGFFATPTSAENVNVFAFGGTGVLVGLFAEVATNRLETVFGSAFSSQHHQPPEESARAEPSGRGL